MSKPLAAFTQKSQWLLWVASGYWQLQEAKFRFSPESGYSKAVICNAVPRQRQSDRQGGLQDVLMP
jgi:hypothetical protein